MRHGLAFTVMGLRLLWWMLKCFTIIAFVLLFWPFWLLGFLLPKKKVIYYAIPKTNAKKVEYVLVKAGKPKSQTILGKLAKWHHEQVTWDTTPASTSTVVAGESHRDQYDCARALKEMGFPPKTSEKMAAEVFAELGPGLDKLVGLALRRLGQQGAR